MPINIDIASVIKSLELLAEELKKSDAKKTISSDDEYWEVDGDNMFEMDKDPSLLVGSIKDDIEYLLDFELVGFRYIYMEKLSSILRAISHYELSGETE